MHHRKAGRQLSRYTAHRIAMFRNMVDSLIEFEQIVTTLPKAKELRKYAERVITLGKRGDLHAYRQALTMLRRKDILRKVFHELATRYKTRPGGYTRILRMGPRPSDAAPMAIIELVDRVTPEASKEAKGGKASGKTKAAKDAGEEKKAEKPVKKAAKAKKSSKADD